jgi:signal transduction histidine kinase
MQYVLAFQYVICLFPPANEVPLAIRGLKTKIAFNVSLLLLISAILTDVLIIIVVQTTWVRDKIEQQSLHIESFGNVFLSVDPGLDGEKVIDRKQQMLSSLLLFSDLSMLSIMDASGNYFFRSNPQSVSANRMDHLLNRVIKSKKMVQEDIGHGRSVFWWRAQAVLVAMPIESEHGVAGGVAALIDLAPIYQKLRQINKPVLLYLIVNTSILTIVGLYRIFRIYLRPIDRLIYQANTYQDENDVLFAFRREDSELARLATALNQMLDRIANDKKVLKSTVASLEEANRELQQAQREVVRAEKMASIGRLSAGIAHEIGNPIGIVLGYLDLLAQTDLSAEERQDFLNRAEIEIQRINTIIRQLLDLARPKEFNPRCVSVHSVLEELLEVMRMQPIMGHIDIQARFEADRDAVWADSDQLRQVFLNLLINAADAIKSDSTIDSGQIVIHTEDGVPCPETSKPCLMVHIKDNGPGISSDHLDTIFDPFYSTKEPGKGTGLGLAVSYTIVEQIGGAIRARNRDGRGAVLSIILMPYDVGADPESESFSKNGLTHAGLTATPETDES